jgi:dolichol-phosphate mannosyltransferase
VCCTQLCSFTLSLVFENFTNIQNVTLSISIAMPLYNEADGIAETLQKIDKAFLNTEYELRIFLQDDVSTDDSCKVVNDISKNLRTKISIEQNLINMGHGPTTQRAYTRAALSNSDYVMQLDSDGQFKASELPDLVRSISSFKPITLGVRKNRTDPWYRKLLTLTLRLFVLIFGRCRSSDPNSPVRVYKTDVLKGLLVKLPEKSLTPNIYLTILASDAKIPLTTKIVTHTIRSGNDSQGTMWRNSKQLDFIIPRKLLTFSFRAFRDLSQFLKNRKRG